MTTSRAVSGDVSPERHYFSKCSFKPVLSGQNSSLHTSPNPALISFLPLCLLKKTKASFLFIQRDPRNPNPHISFPHLLPKSWKAAVSLTSPLPYPKYTTLHHLISSISPLPWRSWQAMVQWLGLCHERLTQALSSRLTVSACTAACPIPSLDRAMFPAIPL